MRVLLETTFPEFVDFARRGQGLAYADEFSWTRRNPTAPRDLIASFGSWRPAVMIRELGRDRPLVYATLGTVFNRMRKPCQALVDGLAELDAAGSR